MSIDGLKLFGFGSLHIGGQDEAFAFEPFEVSQHSLGLVVSRRFFDEALGQPLVLKTPVGQFPLILEAMHPISADPDSLCRGRFRSALADTDFERQLGPVIEDYRAKGHNLQAVRFQFTDPTLAVAKTFGTALNYPFQIENISKSGILLSAELVTAAPFQVNSLIELQFLSQNELIPKSFDCLAKVVRIETAKPQREFNLPKGYGAQFIDLNGNLEADIHQLVSSLERSDEPYAAA